MNVLSLPHNLSIDRSFHITLLQRYRAQTHNGLWHTLADDGYIHAHLTWHMEQAQWWDEIHTLLREETAEGGNGWYQACLKYGYLATYKRDIQRAWRLAEQREGNAVVSNRPADRGEAIALQIRYATLTTLFSSTISQIPASLIAALVSQKHWPLEQVWEIMGQMPPGKQVELLEVLISSEGDCTRALPMVLAVNESSAQARLLSALTPHLSESDWPQVLDHIPHLPEHYRSLVLRRCAEHLPSYLVPQAITLSRSIHHPEMRLLSLSAWVSHHQNLLPEILAQIEQMPEAASQVLCALIPHATSEFLPAVLKYCRAISDPEAQAEVWVALSTHHPEYSSAALEQLLTVPDDFGKATAFANLATDCSIESAEQILHLMIDIPEQTARTLGLSLLVSLLPTELLPELLEATLSLAEHHRVSVWMNIPTSVICQIKPFVDDLVDARPRALALSLLAYADPSLLESALCAAQEIMSPQSRASVLGKIAVHHSVVWPIALDTMEQISDEIARALVLSQVASDLPQGEMEAALKVIRAMKTKAARTQVLDNLAPHLPPSLLSQALDLVQWVPDTSILTTTAQRFQPTRSDYRATRASALKALATYLPEEVLTQDLQMIETLEPQARARALSRLLPQFSVKRRFDMIQFRQWLHNLAVRCYSDFLPDLLALGPAIAQLGGSDSLDMIAQTLDELGQQWAPTRQLITE